MNDICFANGTYRGITYSDESPMAVAELEVVINDHGLTMRIATGTKIVTNVLPRARLHDLTVAEIVGAVGRTDIEDVKGIRLGETGIQFLLLGEFPPARYTPGTREWNTDEWPIPAKDVQRVFVLGMPGEREFGHTVLYLPEQVLDGAFERNIERIEKTMHQTMPRLLYGGRSPY